ncbi:MAG: sugar phosphate nucleotidyltransferase [Tepidiformaceae bacterium]
MDAIILVGGQGTRLRPLTLTRHKSLVPVCNRPAIEYLFDWLAEHGIERAVLALGQANEDLAEAYPAGLHCGVKIVPVLETTRLESGGAIRNAVRNADVAGRFVVLNGDIFVDFDLRAALAEHETRHADLTLALRRVDDPSQFGVAVLDGDHIVTGFVEKPPPGSAPSKLVNAGVWIFEPGLVDEIPPGAVRVEETLFPSLVGRRRPVLGYEFTGLWADIGTPARYRDINVALASRPGAVAASVSREADAVVDLSVVGDGSSLGRDSTVMTSVLWERVSVGTGASVVGSVLADGVEVGEGAVIDGLVAGSGASIPAHAVVPRGTSLQPGARYDARR